MHIYKINENDLTSKVWFNTTKPWLVIDLEDDGMSFTGSDRPINGKPCVPETAIHMFNLPPIVAMQYQDIIGSHEREAGAEKNIKVFVPRVKTIDFDWNYDTVPVTLQNPKRVYAEKAHKDTSIRNNKWRSLLENLTSADQVWEITMYIGDSTYIKMEPVEESALPTWNDLRSYFGKLVLYKQGTLRAQIQSKDFILPTSFRRAINNKPCTFVQDDAYYILPPREVDMIEGSLLKSEEFVGEKAHICNECSKIFSEIKTAKDLQLQMGELREQLAEKIAELESARSVLLHKAKNLLS